MNIDALHAGDFRTLEPRSTPVLPRKTQRHCIASLAMVWALSGCVQPGVLPLPLPMLDAKVVGQDAWSEELVMPEDWWQQFGDPTLDALIRKALADNPTLAGAEARLRRSVANVLRAETTNWPQVAARAENSRQRFPEHALYSPAIGGTTQNLATAQLTLNWELDFFGKNSAALEAALGTARAAQADSATARLLLSANVVRNYLHLARLVALHEIAERSLAQRMEILNLVRRREIAGLDTAVERRQAEGAIPETRQALVFLEEQIVVRRHALAALTAQVPNAVSALAPSITEVRSQIMPSYVPANLLGRRPDVDAARRRVEASRSELDSSRADFYPSVNLVAFVGFNALGLDRLFDDGSRATGIGPALRLPIFDAGRLRANQQVRAAELDSAIASYNGAVLEAVRDASDQISAIQSIERQQQEQTQAQRHAEAAFRLAVQRYRAGLASYLVVLAAETSVLSHRREEVELQARQLDSQAELMRALGGGYADVSSAVEPSQQLK